MRTGKRVTNSGAASQNILYGNYGEDKMGEFGASKIGNSNGNLNQRIVMMSHVPINNISNMGGIGNY